ncbi:MAG: LL-diaminopimelate aminotransferase [Bacillus sp. (in: firmicutes)]
MLIQLADRMKSFSSSIFTELAAYKAAKKKEGAEIIDLSIGSPDLPPPQFVKETISELATNDSQYGYSLKGTAAFHQSVSCFYKINYDVHIEAETEIVQLMGSQDALVHLPMVLANPGDYILVPDPGYTAYTTGIAMAGAVPYYMPLRKENGFLPDLTAIPEEIAQKTSVMILNFPGNPIPVMATKELFEEAIAFAQKYNIVIIHDFAYSELYYTERKPLSFLSVPGSKDVGIELNSLSKSFNMAGCRVAYALGNADLVNALHQFKSNLDYGVFHPVQSAACKALNEGEKFSMQLREQYKARVQTLCEGLRAIGWKVETPEAGMFVWAELPAGWSSKAFTFKLIDLAHVAVTPGIAFGPSGEGYVRIALVQDVPVLLRAIKQIDNSKILQNHIEI